MHKEKKKKISLCVCRLLGLIAELCAKLYAKNEIRKVHRKQIFMHLTYHITVVALRIKKVIFAQKLLMLNYVVQQFFFKSFTLCFKNERIKQNFLRL